MKFFDLFRARAVEAAPIVLEHAGEFLAEPTYAELERRLKTETERCNRMVSKYILERQAHAGTLKALDAAQAELNVIRNQHREAGKLGYEAVSRGKGGRFVPKSALKAVEKAA